MEKLGCRHLKRARVCGRVKDVPWQNVCPANQKVKLVLMNNPDKQN